MVSYCINNHLTITIHPSSYLTHHRIISCMVIISHGRGCDGGARGRQRSQVLHSQRRPCQNHHHSAQRKGYLRLRFNTSQYNTTQYTLAIQHNTLQYNTIQHTLSLSIHALKWTYPLNTTHTWYHHILSTQSINPLLTLSLPTTTTTFTATTTLPPPLPPPFPSPLPPPQHLPPPPPRWSYPLACTSAKWPWSMTRLTAAPSSPPPNPSSSHWRGSNSTR